MKQLLFIALFAPTLCIAQIERRLDDFTGEISINTVMRIGPRMMPAIMFKHINDTDTAYYLSLTAPGPTLNLRERGVIVLFADGTKWHSDAEIDVDSDTSHDGWDYSAFIKLEKSDLNLFSTKPIKKFRLYIYDLSMNADDAGRFVGNVKALTHSN